MPERPQPPRPYAYGIDTEYTRAAEEREADRQLFRGHRESQESHPTVTGHIFIAEMRRAKEWPMVYYLALSQLLTDCRDYPGETTRSLTIYWRLLGLQRERAA